MWSKSVEVLNPYNALKNRDKTICPICKNTMGFAFGVCVQCGYNHLTHEYFEITVNAKVLETLVPEDVFYTLVEEHERRYLR